MIDVATESLEKVIAQKPDFTEAHLNLGYAYRDQDKLTEAVDAFNTARQIDPNNYQVFHELGVTYMKQQRYTEAAIALQQALNIRPEAVQTENNLKVAQARLAQ